MFSEKNDENKCISEKYGKNKCFWKNMVKINVFGDVLKIFGCMLKINVFKDIL